MLAPRTFITLAVVVVIAYLSIFTVNERERAILLKLGEIHRSDYAPGLHFMVPFYNNVRKFDRRLLKVDSRPERYLTGEKKDVIVDSYVRWRIDDVERYFKATRGDQVGAGILLFQKVDAALREQFGNRTVKEVVSGERGEIMTHVTEAANNQVKDLGMQIIDVRVKRIDLPAEVSNSVYQRMRAERERVARDHRSRGEEAAERIRANADRERIVILAEAYRESETTRGEGDATAAAIYANAYGRDEEFYALYRSLNAYRSSFGNKNDILVLEPDSEFFKYFKNSMNP